VPDLDLPLLGALHVQRPEVNRHDDSFHPDLARASPQLTFNAKHCEWLVGPHVGARPLDPIYFVIIGL
jgi:hypothetical protein